MLGCHLLAHRPAVGGIGHGEIACETSLRLWLPLVSVLKMSIAASRQLTSILVGYASEMWLVLRPRSAPARGHAPSRQQFSNSEAPRADLAPT